MTRAPDDRDNARDVQPADEDDTGLKPVTRKLAAILHADVVGYSALSNEDEEGTHALLRPSLDAVTELIAAHGGSVVNYAGDAVLADFPMATSALACAFDIQKMDAGKNSGESAAIRYRIGINLGEVILDRDDVFGDSVNIAARIQGLAHPGGICITQTALSSVGQKLNHKVEDLGEKPLKNIAAPVRVFRIADEDGAISLPVRKTKFKYVMAGLVVAAVAVGALTWFQFSGPKFPEIVNYTNEEIAAFPAIAVLPFRNLGGEPGQDYFSDGVSIDIINDLTRFSRLSVIASNSVFAYKNQSVNVGDVGKNLGVSYVLEGSIQQSGERMRINVQLVEVATGHQKWAERFDVQMTDIFLVQDQITKSVVTSMQVVFTGDESERTARAYTSNIEAYDLFLRGRSYLRGSATTHAKARELFDQAIALDPKFGAAYSEKSLTYFSGFIMPMSRDPEVVKMALADAEKGVELAPTLPLAQARLGWTLFANRRHEEAIDAARLAVALGPSSAESHVQLGNILNWSGQPTDGINQIETAMRLNPQYPFYYLFYLGHAYYLLGDNEKAVELMERVVTRAPHFLPVRRHLAVLYEEAGQTDKAELQSSEIVRIFPGASVQDELSRCFYRWSPELRDRFINGLRASGMPEGETGFVPMKM
jgi:adenylate cyclase